jgi:GNAT superfamily N-acetyltransferase
MVDDADAPASRVLADRAGNRVCIAAWPDGSVRAAPAGQEVRQTAVMPDGEPLLDRIERYYDAVPRRFARVEESGRFTLFLGEPGGWTYYARPALGSTGPFMPGDVTAALDRQAAEGLAPALEWVHETTPTLLDAVRDVGSLRVEELPLLALDGDLTVTTPQLPERIDVRLLTASDEDALAAASAVSVVGFAAEGTARGRQGPAERDATRKPASRRVLGLLAEGAVRIAIAEHDEDGVLATGRTLPLGGVTEVMGVATLPSARRQGLGAAVTARLVGDAASLGLRTVFLSASSPDVARVYAGIGFVRVATAYVARR